MSTAAHSLVITAITTDPTAALVAAATLVAAAAALATGAAALATGAAAAISLCSDLLRHLR